MNSTQIKIVDILKTEYPDFCAYCESSGKVYISDLSNVDFIAFRTRMEKSREYISQIKAHIETAISLTGTSNGNDDKHDISDIPNETSNIIETANDADILGGLDESTYDTSDPIDSRKCNINNDQNPNDSFYNNYPEINIYDIDENVPLYLIFNAYPDNYDFSISAISFSPRVRNCLMISGCTTVKLLLTKSISDLKAMRNLGTRSLIEIIKKTKEYLPASSEKYEPIIHNEPEKITTGEKLFKAVESLLFDNTYSEDELDEDQRAFLDKVKISIETVGSEICMEALYNPQSAKLLCEAFMSFSLPISVFNSIVNTVRNIVNSMSPSTKNRMANPLINIYAAITHLDVSSLQSICDDSTRIFQVPELVGRLDFMSDTQTAIAVNGFLNWCNFDISEAVNRIASDISQSLIKFNDKGVDVIESRIKGDSLEKIGTRFNMTRERVRQIEKKTYRLFWKYYYAQKYDLVLLIYALRDGDCILYLKELESTLGDFAPIIWNAAKQYPQQPFFFYSEEIDAIVVSSGMDEKAINQMLDNARKVWNLFPQTIESSMLEEVIANISQESNVPVEIVQNMFNKSYKLIGKFYSIGSITVTFMCTYVLKQRFPAGFKIGDDFEANRFRQYMIDFFGDRASTITNRAIEAKAADNGVLCDRGKYIHPDYLQVDTSIIQKINDYIDESPRSILSYGEIFDALADILEGSQITNKYILQGALKKYGCRFTTGKDYIRKTQTASLIDELESFVEERGIAHKSEIFSEFPSLSEGTLGQVVARCSNTFNIENGYYIHASSFDIQPNDYKQIRAYLTEACADIPVNIRSVYDAVSAQFPDFMSRNDFDDRSKLFAALNYMFRDEFNFTRPYIAKMGVTDISNKTVILQHIADYDQIEISELVDICEEKNIRYGASSYLIQMVSPEYVRIDAETLMRRELTGITDESVDKAVEIIAGMLEANDYIVASKVNDFLWYPQIELDWNKFLLESIIVQSGKVNIVYLIGDPLKHPNAVYVSDKYKDDTFDSMLIKILTDEVRKGSFMSKVEMRDWLREEGLIEGKLPNFIESAKYFYVDGKGVRCADN